MAKKCFIVQIVGTNNLSVFDETETSEMLDYVTTATGGFMGPDDKNTASMIMDGRISEVFKGPGLPSALIYGNKARTHIYLGNYKKPE